MPPIRDPLQPDLLTWSAPEPVERYEEHRVRASTIAGRLKHAIAETLRQQADLGWDREKIAVAMGAYLGRPVVKASLDAWASEAREGRLPSMEGYAALIAATLDPRLLQVLADEHGWVVIERKWLVNIELASLREHKDEIELRERALKRQGKLLGVL